MCPLLGGAQIVILTDFDYAQKVDVSDGMMRQRIKSAKAAVGSEGKVYFVSQGEYQTQDLDLEHIAFASQRKNYPWIRDEITAWNVHNGRVYGKMGPLVNGLLSLPKVAFTFSPALESLSMQWGDFISNHRGLCIFSASFQEKLKPYLHLFKRDFHCSHIIYLPKFSGFGHDNFHVDLFVNFLNQGALVVSSMPEQCDGDTYLTKSIARYLNKVESFLRENLPSSFQIIQIPLAVCPYGMPNADPHIQEKLALLSYTNLIYLKNSLILPQYILTSAEETFSFGEAKGKIDKFFRATESSRSVYPFPVSQRQAELGGAARCLSWERFE